MLKLINYIFYLNHNFARLEKGFPPLPYIIFFKVFVYIENLDYSPISGGRLIRFND